MSLSVSPVQSVGYVDFPLRKDASDETIAEIKAAVQEKYEQFVEPMLEMIPPTAPSVVRFSLRH